MVSFEFVVFWFTKEYVLGPSSTWFSIRSNGKSEVAPTSFWTEVCWLIYPWVRWVKLVESNKGWSLQNVFLAAKNLVWVNSYKPFLVFWLMWRLRLAFVIWLCEIGVSWKVLASEAKKIVWYYSLPFFRKYFEDIFNSFCVCEMSCEFGDMCELPLCHWYAYLRLQLSPFRKGLLQSLIFVKLYIFSSKYMASFVFVVSCSEGVELEIQSFIEGF